MATRTISVLGGDYNNVLSWDEGAVPTSADDVVARGGGDSGNLTVNVASAAKTAVFTNYTGTLTLSAGWTVSGNLTFVAGMTFTPGTNTVTIDATPTATITSAGKSFYNLTIAPADVLNLTLADNAIVTNDLVHGSVNLNCSGAYNMSVGGNFTRNTGVGYRFGYTTSGAWTIVMNGAGAQNLSGANGMDINCKFTVNKASGTLTIAGNVNFAEYNSPIWTYTAGTVDVGISVVTVLGACTFNSNGMSFYGIIFSGSAITLTSDLTSTNSMKCGSANVVFTAASAKTLHCQGNFSRTSGVGYRFGYLGSTNTTLQFDGGNNQQLGDANNCLIDIPVIINKSGNTLTLANTINFSENNAPSWTWIAGTVAPGTSLLNIGSACTLNTDGMSWYAITMGANITLSSNLTLTQNWTRTAGALSGNYAVIFAGTSTLAGATTFYNLSLASNSALHLTKAQTFVVSNTFSASGVLGSSTTLNTDVLTSRANLTVTLGVGSASQLEYIIATDIDSSGGGIVTYGGATSTITNCVNWLLSTSAATAIFGYMSCNTKFW